jgi:hypothetical protein
LISPSVIPCAAGVAVPAAVWQVGNWTGEAGGRRRNRAYLCFTLHPHPRSRWSLYRRWCHSEAAWDFTICNRWTKFWKLCAAVVLLFLDNRWTAVKPPAGLSRTCRRPPARSTSAAQYAFDALAMRRSNGSAFSFWLTRTWPLLMRTENPRVGGWIPPLGTFSEEGAVPGVPSVPARADVRRRMVTPLLERPPSELRAPPSHRRSAGCSWRSVRGNPPPQNDPNRDGASPRRASLVDRLRLLGV